MPPSELKKARAKAKDAFRKYIVKRDASEGYARCPTCGKSVLLCDLQCGHYLAGCRGLVQFDERNAHAQCQQDNMGGEKNEEYTAWMLGEYGQEVIDELIKLDNTEHRFSVTELLEIAKHYRDKTEELE